MRLNAFLSLFVNLENTNDYTIFFADFYPAAYLVDWTGTEGENASVSPKPTTPMASRTESNKLQKQQQR